MDGPIAYWNGKLIPADEARVPVYDAGFVQGVTVAEQLRTFGGQLFELRKHLDRLQRSLGIIGLESAVDIEPLAEVAQHVARHNGQFLTEGDDLGLCLFVTPGPYSPMAAVLPDSQLAPSVCMHTYPIPFHLFARMYQTGQSLITTSIRQVSVNCWAPELKCRSRMHYYLADKEARSVQPDARALLLDPDGFVAEASTANIVAYSESTGLVSPPKEKILPGISIAVTADLAQAMGVSIEYQDLTVDDLLAADELMLCSTSVCVLPVVSVNRTPIGSGCPGPFFARLLSAWSTRTGLDIQQQAIERSAKLPTASRDDLHE